MAAPIPVPALRLRPMTLADVLDESFRLYRANFPLLAGLALLMVIPLIAVNVASGGYSALGAVFSAVTNPSGAVPAPFGPSNPFLGLLVYPVQLALVPFRSGVLFVAAVAIVLGNRFSFLDALKAVWRRYWAIFVLALLYGLATWTLLCPPLGIWLTARLALMMPVLFTEQASMGAAIERSWRLTEQAFWRTLCLLVLASILLIVLTYSLGGVLIAIAGVFPGIDRGVRLILIGSATELMTQLVQPLFALAVTILYFDLRVRREAFDLEMMAYQLAAAPEPST